MQTQFVGLYSDGLLWLMVLLLIGYVVHVYRHPHLRAPWRQVLSHRVGIISAVVLCVYAVICLLDSVHWQQTTRNQQGTAQVQVVSALDRLLPQTMVIPERSYSAPLSQTDFTQSSWSDAQGQSVRGYAPLHGVAQVEQRSRDIAGRVVTGFLRAVVVIACVSMVILLCQLYRLQRATWRWVVTIMQGRSTYAWRAMWLTFSAVVVVLCIGWQLAAGYHLFGTTQIGQDVLYESIKSVRTGMVIGTLTTLFMLPLALTLGLSAGYFGGWCDDIIQYLYITLSSIPGVLLISASILVLQVTIHQHADWFPTMEARADMRLLALCLILGLTSWATLCRLLRAETMKLKQMDYVSVARTLGVRSSRLLMRHVLPNVMHIIMITVVLDFSGLVLAEAVLSYVGVGVDPTTHSWGNMINSARLEMAREPIVWWPLVSALIMMFGLVLSANCFADAVRDAWDPRVTE